MTFQDRLQAFAERVGIEAKTLHARVTAQAPRLAPSGGQLGQLLMKVSEGNYPFAWATPRIESGELVLVLDGGLAGDDETESPVLDGGSI